MFYATRHAAAVIAARNIQPAFVITAYFDRAMKGKL
jgi:hypothetical protein